MLAEVEAVVPGQHDHGVLPEVETVERVEEHPHLRVGEGHAGLVRGHRLPPEGGVRDEAGRLAAEQRQAGQRLRLRLDRDRRHVGEVVRRERQRGHRLRRVEAEVARGRDPAQVRAHEAHGEEERSVAGSARGAQPRAAPGGRRAGRGPSPRPSPRDPRRPSPTARPSCSSSTTSGCSSRTSQRKFSGKWRTFPTAAVTAPCAAKCSWSGTAPSGRGGSTFVQTPVRSGRQPVSIDDARRAAHRDRHVGPVEADPARGEAVDGRRLHGRAPGADPRVEVVDEDQEHVAPGRSQRAPPGLGAPGASRLERAAHLLDRRTVLGARREVRDLAGVRVVVVELAAAVGPLGVAPASGARAAADAAGPPRDGRERLRPARGPGSARSGIRLRPARPGSAARPARARSVGAASSVETRRLEAWPGRDSPGVATTSVERSVSSKSASGRVRRPCAPAVGRRVADDDDRGARGGALDEGDEGRELPVRRERALEVGGRRALPRGLGPRRRPHLAARAVGEAEVGDRDARQRGRERAGQRRRGRQARAPGPAHPRPRRPAGTAPLRAQPLLEARGHGRLADAPGKVEVPLGGLEGERTTGAHARDRRAPRPEERGDRALAGAEQGRAGGARLGIGSERRLEGAARGGEPREGRRPPRLSLAPEAVREHEHDAARGRRRGRGRDEPARRPEGGDEDHAEKQEKSAAHGTAIIPVRGSGLEL